MQKHVVLFGLPVILLLCSCTTMKHPSDSPSLIGTMNALTETHRVTTVPLLSRPFQQAWLDETDKDFEPALARLHAETDGLVVLAVLKDRHIHNSAEGFNQKTWNTGDVFEIFIEVSPDKYFEFHVTPENRHLFLRWSPALFAAVGRKEAEFESALIHNRDFLKSRTHVNRTLNLWTVYAHIPYEALGIDPDNANLRVAFARYDTTPGSEKPVLSATPDFPKASYHIRDAWHRVKLTR